MMTETERELYVSAMNVILAIPERSLRVQYPNLHYYLEEMAKAVTRLQQREPGQAHTFPREQPQPTRQPRGIRLRG